ncbi:hypothetical protein EK21DRAFT_50905, partial [Setomelanomma holmii]
GDSLRLRSAPRDRAGEREVLRLSRRIAWLESIIRNRLHDVDLSGNASRQQQERQSELTPPISTTDQLARPPDRRAHEIGLISIGAHTDPKYIGPSSGYFLARFLLAKSSQKNVWPVSRAESSASQSIINDLIDAVQGPLPFPNQSLVDRLCKAYFDTIHPQWPVLHEPSFRAAVDKMLSERVTNAGSRQEDPHVSFHLYMVLAISATILSHRSKRQFSGESYCLSALQYFDQLNLQSSIQGLQCMLLLLIFTFHNPHMRLSIWHLNYQCVAAVVDLGLQRNVTASSGISLVDQEMRTRLFWTVYTLDRSISTMMGRPIGLRDEACELRLPNDLDEEDLPGPAPTVGSASCIAISIHFFKLAKLNSELKYVANSIVREAPSYAYPPITDILAWQRDMLSRFDEWSSRFPRDVSGNTYMETLCEIRYHAMKVLLLRPSPAIPIPSSGALIECHESARKSIRLYDKLYRQELMVHDWITLHGIISATITMIYCLRSVSELAMNVKLEDLVGDTNISLSILGAMGEH